MKKDFITNVFLALIVIFIGQINISIAKETATVISVIDGDTIKIKYNNLNEKVRLIGIDTPESTDNNKAYRDASRTQKDLNSIIAQGIKAKAFTSSLVHSGDKVDLEFDIEKRDHYHRLLAYVFLSNGKMLNEEVIKHGYASPMTIPPNIK